MRRRSPSILHRIVWLHVAVLAGLTIAVSAAAFFLLNATVNDFEEQVLRDHAASVAQHLTFSGGRWKLALPPDLAAIYAKGYGGYALAVLGDDGQVIYSSLPNDRAFTGARPSAQFSQQRSGASIYYDVTVPVAGNGHHGWIEVGQNLQNPDVIIDDVVTLFLERIAWLALPILTVLLVADVLLMRRLMAPVIAASHVASAIGPSKPLIRLPTAGLPREVLPLAEAVNEAFTRLEKGLQAQREFTADAAHELRTPLAVLRTHVDTLLDGAKAAALQSDIDAMGHVLDQLLQLAELENVSIAQGTLIDLNALGTEVVSLMAPLALAENKSLEFSGSSVQALAFGDGEMLLRALRNLVENAIRHSRPRQHVEVEVAAPAIIHVKDRGPGIPPAERELVFRRFWRRDRQNKGHAGLGLAIVSKIAQLHGGAVTVAQRDGGGATFSIVLPNPEPSSP